MNRNVQEFFKNDQGQATTEYILIISVVVTLLTAMIKRILAPLFARLSQTISQSIEQKFSSANLHHFRIRR